jgi:hypothetical protein
MEAHMCSGGSSFGLSFIKDRQLFNEMERMVEEDRAMHARVAAEGSLFDGSYVRLDELHRRNADRLKAIIAKHGWPGRSLVGEEGATYAWMIVQHASGDIDFQRRGLELIKDAVSRHEAPMSHAAYLEDLIRVTEGRPQIYGTQFEVDKDGLMSPLPIEDPAHVNDRRRAVGLDRIEERARVVRDEAAFVGSRVRNPR